jgi:hypothetical protein
MTNDALVFIAAGGLGVLYFIENFRLKLGPRQRWWQWAAWVCFVVVVLMSCIAFVRLVQDTFQG